MNDASFRLNRVCRRLSETFRLSIDDLTVRRGEVFALLGPTGAGKTTLMRLLTGLEFPDEGVIQFGGAPLDRESPLSLLRDITMVHQRPLLLAGSVETNVAYGLRARRRAPNSKVTDVLNRLGLGPLARRDARLLSGGQMQLVALARALVLEPKILLLDEPTANLGPGLRRAGRGSDWRIPVGPRNDGRLGDAQLISGTSSEPVGDSAARRKCRRGRRKHDFLCQPPRRSNGGFHPRKNGVLMKSQRMPAMCLAAIAQR